MIQITKEEYNIILRWAWWNTKVGTCRPLAFKKINQWLIVLSYYEAGKFLKAYNEILGDLPK